MGQKSGKTKRTKKRKKTRKTVKATPGAATNRSKMKRKEYERELATLQAELVAMQEWVKSSGAKVCIVFEGRDTAGKGGTIKRITERVSPRVFHVIALSAPTEREKSQMYIQRYLPHFPAAGEVVIFDRSWYNRAGVEPVMGFCTPEEAARFLERTTTPVRGTPCWRRPTPRGRRGSSRTPTSRSGAV
jgi:polyphosphate kinase 2 (PPK2 family)